jgi:hypothetical protein
MTYLWLSDAEIADLCAPLKRSDAQARYMERLGLRVMQKPNGRPLVMRADVEALGLGAAKPAPGGREPDRAALRAAFRLAV